MAVIRNDKKFFLMTDLGLRVNHIYKKTLYKIGLAISVPVLPISANVCILCLKRLQSLPQTFAVKRRLLWNPFPSCFSAEPKCAMERDVMSEP